MRAPVTFSLFIGCLLSVVACEPDVIRPSAEHDFQWDLPRYIHEPSGLALSRAGLLTHADELGYIYRIADDFSEVTRVLQLENPVMSVDFEGIAVDGNTVYLMDNTGHIYIAENVSFGPHSIVERVIRQQTGLGRQCELEGLAYQAGLLLLPCKTALNDEYRGQLTVFSFDPQTAIASEFIRILIEDDNPQDLALTAIAAQGNDYYLLTTGQLIIVNPLEQSSRLIELDRSIHPQPEDIVVTASGNVIIVDDRRTGIGRISFYNSLEHLTAVNAPD